MINTLILSVSRPAAGQSGMPSTQPADSSITPCLLATIVSSREQLCDRDFAISLPESLQTSDGAIHLFLTAFVTLHAIQQFG